MELTIEKAKKTNVAACTVFRQSHVGRLAAYPLMAARAGMIGIAYTIGAINHMTPWGGAEAILGNNPFSYAYPTRQGFPIVLDMACSIAARGKIIVAAKEGKPIPGDWATGPDGLPTTDADEALKGFVLPIGGAKGYALTLSIGLMSTLLSGAAFGNDVGELYEKTTTAQDCGHLFGVLPITSFTDYDTYLDRMDRAIADVRGVKKSPGVERIYLPGEREHLAAIDRTTSGIPLGKELVKELGTWANRLGIEPPAEA
jgi:LDH2 family malate/lactate/ureidoglycolate dehydrogenase